MSTSPTLSGETNPQLFQIPRGCTPRLVDRGLLQHEASLAGRSERYGRGETSHTVHVWWARRPHAAMRALVFSSICRDHGKHALELLNQLSTTAMPDLQLLTRAKECLRSGYKHRPRVLDMFGGGGTIAFESSMLDLEAHSIDSNQLSVFLQRSNLTRSLSVSSEEVSALMRSSGTRILNRLRDLTNPLFPARLSDFSSESERQITTYIWSYLRQCSNCGYSFSLCKRPWLSKKSGKRIALVVRESPGVQLLGIHDVGIDYEFESNWVGKNGVIRCPKCQNTEERVSALECEDDLVAVICSGQPRGKVFRPPPEKSLPSYSVLESTESEVLEELEAELPQTELPVWSGIVNPAIYGIRTHADFLNRRQRVVLLLLIKCLRDEHRELLDEHDRGIAEYVTAQLTALIDQLVDWNCRLSMWISQNEQVGRAFCGPGVSMLWDYAETDPVSSGPANLWSKLDRIVEGCKTITNLPSTVCVKHAVAQSLPYKDEHFDAIVTDPPYYDNIFYSVLADFFYSWKRLLLKEIDPDLFANEKTDFEHELVSSTRRNGTPQAAHEEYCRNLSLAMQEAARVLKKNGVFSFIYTHSSVDGWEALVRAYRSAMLRVTSVQPLSVERRQRPRAMKSEAVNTCIAFIARRHNLKRKNRHIDDLVREFMAIANSGLSARLEEAGWHSDDIALAVFAQGVALVSNSARILGVENDRMALLKVASCLTADFPSFKLKTRSSL